MMPLGKITNESLMEIYLDFTIQIIENFDNPAWRHLKNAFITIHRKYCSRRTTSYCVCASFNTTDPDRMTGYTLLEDFLVTQAANQSSYNCITFALLTINLYRRHNLFKASLIHHHMASRKHGIRDSITLSVISDVIQCRASQFDASDSSSIVDSSIRRCVADVGQLLVFEKRLFEFKEDMAKVSYAKHAMLVNIESPKDVIRNKIGHHSEYIYRESEKIARSFNQLIKLRPDSMSLLVTYTYFNLLVLNLKSEAKRAKQKIQALLEENERNSRIKTSTPKPVKGLISVSLNPAQRGQITLADQYVLNMLRYKKEDLIGMNLSEILPDDLAARHDMYLKTFVEKTDSRVINKQRLRFFINSEKYMVPVILVVKFHFSTEFGIYVVGLVYEYMGMERFQLRSKLRYYMSYNQITGDIGYVCGNCSKYLGF